MDSFLTPILVSLEVSLWSLGIAWPGAILLAWFFATRDFRGKSFFLSLMMMPAVMPPLVIGYLLLLALRPQSPLGGFLAAWGIQVPLTQKGAILAAMVVGWPYLFAHARQAFLSMDRRLLEAAANLGVSPARCLVKIAIPLVLPGILTGGLLAWARGLGEFGATLVLAGSIPGETQTITLRIYQLMESPLREKEAWILVGWLLLWVILVLAWVETVSRTRRFWQPGPGKGQEEDF